MSVPASTPAPGVPEDVLNFVSDGSQLVVPLALGEPTPEHVALARLKANMRLTIKGKDDVIDQVLICLAAGLAAGLLNATLIARVGIPSLVVTLAMLASVSALGMVAVARHGKRHAARRGPLAGARRAERADDGAVAEEHRGLVRVDVRSQDVDGLVFAGPLLGRRCGCTGQGRIQAGRGGCTAGCAGAGGCAHHAGPLRTSARWFGWRAHHHAARRFHHHAQLDLARPWLGG